MSKDKQKAPDLSSTEAKVRRKPLSEDVKKKIDGGKIDWYNAIRNMVSVNGIEVHIEDFKQFLFERGYEGTLFRICAAEEAANKAIIDVLSKH